MTEPADLHDLFQLPPEQMVLRVVDALDRAAAGGDPRLLDELVDVAEDAARFGLSELARFVVAGLLAVLLGQDPREIRGMVLPDDLHGRDPVDDALSAVLGSAQAAIPVVTRLLGVVARLAERQGDIDRAVSLLSRAAAENDRIGQELWAAIHRQSLGAVLARAGRIRDADVQSRLAQRTYERLGDRARLAAVLLNQAQNALTVDELDRAEELLGRAETVAAADETGHLGLSAALLRAMTLLQRGDVDSAERALRSVIAASRRAGDLPMQRVATQNVATLLSNHQRAGRAVPWFDRALDLAQREGDPEAVTALLRSRARNFARLGRHDEAVELLRDVLASETGPHAGPSRARTMSDLAAALLMRATGQRDRSSTRARDLAAARPGRAADLVEADELLRGAVLEQLASDDERGWLDQTLANLVGLRRLQGRTAEAAAELVEWAGRTRDDGRDRALLEDAARLLIEIGDVDGAVELFQRAAAPGEDDDHRGALAQVQSLVLAAGELDQGGHQEAALAFYLEAAAVLDRRGGHAPFRNDIRNDTAIVLTELGRRDEARELLIANVLAARSDQNRVELAKALANLGEVNRRDDRFEEAAGQLEEAAGLHEEVGDYAVAAETWALLCNTYALLDRREDARSAARSAVAAAEREPTPLAEGRALDARALVQSLDGNHAVAANLAFQAAGGQEGVHRLESLAYAAEEHARDGNWPRFRKVLDRLAAEALADTALTGRGGLLLVRPARVWLVAGYPRRAARALAYCLALALSAAANVLGAPGPDSPEAPEEQLIRAFGSVAEVLTTADADPSDQRRCRAEVLRQVKRTAPGASQLTAELLEQAEKAVLQAIPRQAE